MSEIFFIADTHFGHRGIIEFSETKPHRPFATIEDHDEELIRRWNATVNPKDTVWHLGGLCFGKRNLDIAARLNCNKKLVTGNHDMYATEDYLRYFTRLAGIVEYEGLLLSHAPVHESQLSRWYMNVHGHLHTKALPDPRYVCASCEQVNLARFRSTGFLTSGRSITDDQNHRQNSVRQPCLRRRPAHQRRARVR